MNQKKKIAHFGLWESHLDSEAILTKGQEPNYPFQYKGCLYWLQNLSGAHSGKTVLCKVIDEEGQARSEIITPLSFDVSTNFNIRTRVNEYGGKCFCIIDDYFIFNNYQEGSLYAQKIRHDTTPATDVHWIGKYRYCKKLKGRDLPIKLAEWNNQPIPGFADLLISPDGQWIVAVMETPSDESGSYCQIVKIRWQLNTSGEPDLQRIETLISGADFYANPVIFSDGSKMSWIEWSHPNMPWDRTRLMCADLDLNESRPVQNEIRIIDRENWSVCQIGYLNNGDLLFISDNPECDFWNFYQYSSKGELKQITDEEGEFGEAHWQFGQSRWKERSDGIIVAIFTERDGDRIIELNTKTSEIHSITHQHAALNQMSLSDDGILLCMAYYENRPSSVVRVKHLGLDEIDIEREERNNFDHTPCPEFIEFPTSKGEKAYGLFFEPMNPEYEGISSHLPPLIVMIHGGPTGRSSRMYEGIRHHYCSLGFAILDVNHRGSTGFGRVYRQSLNGNWGIDDCEDIAAGIGYLVEKQRVDPELVFIRGGSAGGYAVQRALTQHNDLFCAGASYYGIGNLITLSEITHRFESRYTDQLIGEEFDAVRARNPDSRYTQRSPVFDMDRLNCPLILFQGSEDKVVPPELSHEVVRILKSKGIHHAYYEFAGEGHGFRNKTTKLTALTHEVEFFTNIIREKRGVS
ncbi:MAG: prolyl oligopeptidase family serine peptidase [Gammaproteobacteria bacterium]|nr:prolyl oligopeptidase family serine peptidase [Gammaproteobacteria bacterium]MCY4218246.1 prolyl oligopeptidase family serine peptidase [Gammaproteobacteria bacterium]